MLIQNGEVKNLLFGLGLGSKKGAWVSECLCSESMVNRSQGNGDDKICGPASEVVGRILYFRDSVFT